jgi:hypothetical protein
MSRSTAATHDATRAPLRRTHLLAVPIAALVALALGLPATGHAASGKSPSGGPGKADQHKPAGVGGGRRVR